MSISSCSPGDCPERGFADCIRRAGDGDDGAVGGLARIHVEQRGTLDLFDDGCDLPDDFGIASFTEIGDAFDESGHGDPGKRSGKLTPEPAFVQEQQRAH